MSEEKPTLENVKEHFEKIAGEYDFHKKRAWYYYDWLKKICKWHIPLASQKRILELGCGTGDIIAFLNPKYGLGIDISENMIKLARKKHPQKNLHFAVGAGENMKLKEKFDVILMPDVIEHLADHKKTFEQLHKTCDTKTRVIITMINPLWEPVFMLWEMLGWKMPEGPHTRVTYGKLKKIFRMTGFKVIKRRFYVALPLYFKYISNPLNYVFNRIPLIRRFGLIEVIEVKKA
ncbi:MAG: methyltransferase domain-containing protein [Candidatus Woesearchaeota archaeon]